MKRLIDADKLIEEMSKWYWDKEKQKASEEDVSPMDLFTHLAITTVQEQPTVMKLNNEICISFLQGSGWMRNHDEKVKNGIIDKFVERIRERLEINNTSNMIDINIVAQELKEEENKWKNRYW